jgi:opacity protein-like surface antigen
MKALALGLLLTAGLSAQHLGYGIVGGVPFNDVLSGSSIGTIAESGRYSIGPLVELRLPIVSIEADALYHGDSYALQSNGVSTTGSGSTWQFPIVGKVKIPLAPIVKPYAEAGVAFRTFSSSSFQIDSNSKKGFVLGAGIDIHAVVLHITPELRYTRWGSQSGPLLQANQNQFEFLVGISR